MSHSEADDFAARSSVDELTHNQSVEKGTPHRCSACAAQEAKGISYVYTVGRIEPRFPNISVEKEFAQAVGRDETSGLTDRQALHRVLSTPKNRYLIRHLCWVMTVQGVDTFILLPRIPSDSDLLVDSLRPNPTPQDLDVVIGMKGPIATAALCNGLMIPIVIFDQIYSFDIASLVESIPQPEHKNTQQFHRAAEEVFARILQTADNAGDLPQHRALNYMALRYPGVYATAFDAHNRNATLTGVNVQPSSISGSREVMEVIWTFSNRKTDVIEKFMSRVDVTDEFPFLVTKMSPYVDR